jgi:hypothetical protein
MKHYLSPEGQIYAYELDGSQDYLIPNNYTAITNEHAAAIRDQILADQYNLLGYSEKRKIEYPSIADQFDLLYHGGYDVWKAAIQVVKDKYPKT